MCDADISTIKSKYEQISPFLNEKQRRIWCGTEALSIGWGGHTAVSGATGLTRSTVSRGAHDVINQIMLPLGRIRQYGGGRKRLETKDPTLKRDLLTIVAPNTRGDPQSPLQWVSKSLTNIVKALNMLKHHISVSVVRRILREEHYSLQSNRKTNEGGDHPERDAQFSHIGMTVDNFLSNDQPAISVDTKKKELIGQFKNQGQEWRPQSTPISVNVYDFPSLGLGRANPYGIYDLKQNHGFVNVGISKDTGAFAVESIRQWWLQEGQFTYQSAAKLLITADGGGSNGSRLRLWKTELQKLANETNLAITVCHYPPGTSKWNKIEHRLFSHISRNWRAVPLDSVETMVGLIQNTTTTKGLTVTCQHDMREYPKGIKISDKQLAEVNIERNFFQGKWNYTISPNTKKYIEQVIFK